MKLNPKKLLRNANIHPISAITFIINFIIIIIIFLIRNNLPPELPLFYARPEGEDQLASQASLVLPAVIALAIVVLNSFIIKFIYDDFLKKLLLGVIIVTTLLSTITIFKIIFLVGTL